MKPTISAIAKSTKDYPRPCRGVSLMGSQEVPDRDEWPTMKGYVPRLAGLVGCCTGDGVKVAGPAQSAAIDAAVGDPTLQHISVDDVIELSERLL